MFCYSGVFVRASCTRLIYRLGTTVLAEALSRLCNTSTGCGLHHDVMNVVNSYTFFILASHDEPWKIFLKGESGCNNLLITALDLYFLKTNKMLLIPFFH